MEAKKLIEKLPEQTKLIVRFGVETGTRISDILKLKPEQIKREIKIYETKSKRDRTVKISGQLYQDIREYSKYKEDGSILFESAKKRNKNVSRVTIHRHIKKALKTLNFNASIHSTRKLYAQNVFRATGSIEEVKKSLNHHSILTTASYLDIDVEALVKSLGKMSKA